MFERLTIDDFRTEKLKMAAFDTATINFGGGTTAQYLTDSQNHATVLYLTNAGGAANLYALPTLGKMFIVGNASGQTITVMAFGQTGVQVPTGSVVIIGSNGTDFAAVSTTSTSISGGTVTNSTLTGNIFSGIAKATAQLDKASNVTLGSVTGMSVTVVPGTYKFTVRLPGTSTANGGIKFAFKLTTTVLTSIEATGMGFTAAAVAVQHTTTTADQTLLFDQKAAVIYTEITGSMVVGTGGTIALQMAQDTSHADTSSVYVGATMDFTRIL